MLGTQDQCDQFSSQEKPMHPGKWQILGLDQFCHFLAHSSPSHHIPTGVKSQSVHLFFHLTVAYWVAAMFQVLCWETQLEQYIEFPALVEFMAKQLQDKDWIGRKSGT